MKKLMVKFYMILFAALAFVGSANAAYLPYWFDPTGNGNVGGAAVKVNEFLDYIGAVYAENTYTSETQFDLQQSGYAEIIGRDSSSTASFIVNGIVASYSGDGTGTLGGQTEFTSGTISLFAGGYGNTLIAEFEITGGGAEQLNAAGAPNGASNLIGRATFFEEGYFFKDNGGTISLTDDFGTFDLDQEIMFGFATSNLSFSSNQQTIDEQQASLNQAFPGNSFSGINVLDGDGRLTNLYSGSNGQFRLEDTEVPEPGVLSLVGLAFLLMGAMTRRQSK